MVQCSSAFVIILVFINISLSFKLKSSRIYSTRKISSLVLCSTDRNKIGGDQLSKILFSFSESFGRLVSSSESKIFITNSLPTTFEEATSRIQSEYEDIFFATGNMDMALWAKNCTFADPFSSFGGPDSLQRFKNNADNFSKFLSDPSLRIVKVSSNMEERTVSVEWVFKSYLKLPWRPILAAAGETTHYLDEQFQTILYQERWKSKPFEVIKRLFVPT